MFLLDNNWYDGLTINLQQISKLSRKQMVHIKLTHQNTISYSNLSIPLQLIFKTSIMSQNPYQKIYDDLNITITPDTTLAQAETLARHLGYLYNTFGLMVKDFISLLGYRFRTQHPFLNDKNKKDRKNTNFQPRTDKKARSQDEMEDQQLEGKSIPAPPNNFYQFQNHNQPGKSSNSQLNLPSQSKHTHPNNSSHQPNHDSSNTLQKQPPKDLLPNQQSNPKNIPAQSKNLQTENKDSSTIQTTKPSQNPDQTSIRKIIPRKKRDHEVINISSEDQQKEEDSLSGVKTRAQHRGENKSMMRPDSLLRRGRGRGRGRRGRPSSRSSSRFDDGNQDERKSLSSYPLHPNDPFTVIHNVPYRPSSKVSSNLSPGSTPSKKDQKLQKKLQKQMSQSSQSQKEYQGENEEQSKQVNRNQNKGQNYNTNQSKNQSQSKKSPYNNESFIKKVMTSYLQQKQEIREKLDNLDKEYEKQKLVFKPKVNQNLNNTNNKGKQNSNNGQQPQDDGYEYEVQEEVSFEQVPQEEDNFEQDQEIMVEEHDLNQIQMQEYQQEQALPFQKLNPSPKPSPKPLDHKQNHKDSYNYLQQINQSIQQQFEQNLRMNHQIDDQNQYEEEISYSSPPNVLIDEEQDQQYEEQVVPESDMRNQQEVRGGENIQAEMGEIMIEKESGKVIDESQQNIRSEQNGPNEQNGQNQYNNQNNNNNNDNGLFDSLFQYQSNQQKQNQIISLDQNHLPQNKPSNTQLSHHQVINQLQSSIDPQNLNHSSPIQHQQAALRKNSSTSQSQKPILPVQNYFPFIQGIPNPETNQSVNHKEIPNHNSQQISSVNNNIINNKQPKQPKQPNSSDKEQLLKVLDAFEPDEEQPKKGVNKPPVTPDLRQALIDKLTLMKKNQLKSQIKPGNLLKPTKQSIGSSIEKPPLTNSSLLIQNNSILQNKPLAPNSTDNKLLPLGSDQQNTTTAINDANTHGVNGTTKPVDQAVSDNKKQNISEFVSFPKKAKYIEVIELQ